MDEINYVIESAPPVTKGGAGLPLSSGGARFYRSGASFLFPFRNQAVPYSTTQSSLCYLARLGFNARIASMRIRFDVQDSGLWFFPFYSLMNAVVPAVVAVTNGSLGDGVAISRFGQDPTIGNCALESDDSLMVHPIPLGYIFQQVPVVFGLYVCNQASDSATHYLSGYLDVHELVKHSG